MVSTAAAQALVELVQKESDNNVKIIVLDRIDTLRAKHEHVLDNLAMDILRVLTTSTDMEVRRKAVGIVLHMVTGKNVEEVVGSLKKQLTRTLEAEYEKVRPLFSIHSIKRGKGADEVSRYRTWNTAISSFKAFTYAPSNFLTSLRRSSTRSWGF